MSYLTIAGYGFFLGGAYGSLPDAAIWWCLRTGRGGRSNQFNPILTRASDVHPQLLVLVFIQVPGLI